MEGQNEHVGNGTINDKLDGRIVKITTNTSKLLILLSLILVLFTFIILTGNPDQHHQYHE